MTASPLPASETARPRVLAIDDDRVMRRVITRILTGAGMDVVAVEVDEALLLIEDREFDLVICDRSMPGVSGQEFLDVVRSDHRFDFTPFLFLTVSEAVADIVDGFEGGADDYITKPFNSDELIARVRSRLDRARQIKARDTALVDVQTFAFEAERELTRIRGGDPGGVLAIVTIPSLQAVAASLGERERRSVLEQIAATMAEAAGPLDVIGATRHGDLAILMPKTSVREAANRLREMASTAAALVTYARGLTIRPVPMIGFYRLESRRVDSMDTVFARAAQAALEAESTQDLQPRLWIAPPADDGEEKTDHHPAREALQVVATFALGILVPFLVYLALDAYGLDVSWPVYIAVVLALVSTAALIMMESVYAGRHPGAPPVAGAPEPPASAIICAYMPNEAATIMETVAHFMTVHYPAGLQVILAYNTPEYLPVEAELQAFAEHHPNLLLLKVEGSNSKAQNLNAALARATGEFIGVFDADHHPDPDSFHRAWRWLSNGYDVVQGHCLVRNPADTFLARMVAVEFETIYAVAHPGRWLRDGFGIFGGSNGYWRTEALHMTRMRGSMLTEDIDASMRVLEARGRIASDPGLISRELATTTARQIWNQRLRWAQGWTQVSIRHLWAMMRLPHFNARQKFGVFVLLLQREIYPWISFQIFPLILFWWARGEVLDWFVPLFVAATIFTTAVGPSTTLMAYRLAHPTIKNKWWFLQYGLFSTLFYTEAKNVIGRVGHLKELLKESSWRVTPRSADPASPMLPQAVAETLFRGEAAPHERPATPIDMLAYTRSTTGSCLWCGETRSIDVARCSRCGNSWIDQTLAQAARSPAPPALVQMPVQERQSNERRAGFGYAVVALVAVVVGVGVFLAAGGIGTTADSRQPDQIAATIAPLPRDPAPPTTVETTAPPMTSAVPVPTTLPVPTTAVPPSTSTTSTSTTTSTTTLPPLPATQPIPLAELALGAFAFGPLDFGADGAEAAGRLVASFGQPVQRSLADEQWGLCSGQTGRVLHWEGFSAVFRDDGDDEDFVAYRYEGPLSGGIDLRTISGLAVGMTIEDADALYPSSLLETSRLEDGTPIYLLLRSSDRRTLIWGPMASDGEPRIAGIYSYRPCDRGPFPD